MSEYLERVAAQRQEEDRQGAPPLAKAAAVWGDSSSAFEEHDGARLLAMPVEVSMDDWRRFVAWGERMRGGTVADTFRMLLDEAGA